MDINLLYPDSLKLEDDFKTIPPTKSVPLYVGTVNRDPDFY